MTTREDLYDDPYYKAFITRLVTNIDDTFKSELMDAYNEPLDNMVPGYPLPMTTPEPAPAGLNRPTKHAIIKELQEVTAQLSMAMNSLAADAALTGGIKSNYHWSDWEIVSDRQCTITTNIPCVEYPQKWSWLPQWYVAFRQRALIRSFGYIERPSIRLMKFESQLNKPYIVCHPALLSQLKEALAQQEDLDELVNRVHRAANAQKSTIWNL